MVPSFIYIVGNQPRGGGDVAIPGPVAFVGVTVVAGSLKDLTNFLWRGDFQFHGGVLPVDWYQLQYQEGDTDSRPHFLLGAHGHLS